MLTTLLACSIAGLFLQITAAGEAASEKSSPNVFLPANPLVGIYKEILDRYETIYKKEPAKEFKFPKDQVQTIQLGLEKIHNQLRLFVREHHFDHERFGTCEVEIELNLSILMKMVGEFPEPPENLIQQAQFTKLVFDLMSEATKYEKNPITEIYPYRSMITSMYSLRISVLMMFNAQGLPNHTIRYFRLNLNFLAEKWHQFGEKRFRTLAAAPSAVIMIIWSQFQETGRALERLANSKHTETEMDSI